MRIEAGDDIRIAIAIHIQSEHLRAAAAVGERKGVELPAKFRAEILRLLPPSSLQEQILAPVPVDVAYTQAMAILAADITRRNRVENPRCCRIG